MTQGAELYQAQAKFRFLAKPGKDLARAQIIAFPSMHMGLVLGPGALAFDSNQERSAILCNVRLVMVITGELVPRATLLVWR